MLLALISISFAGTFYEAYTRGVGLEKQEKWMEAREMFLESARLRPAPGRRVQTSGFNSIRNYDPYIHLAHCEARLGMIEEAKQHFAMSKSAGVTPAPLLNEIQKRFEKMKNRGSEDLPSSGAVEPETALIKVQSEPARSSVIINGKKAGSTPLEVQLPAGRHRIRYELSGYNTVERSLDVKKGESQILSVMLAKLVLPSVQVPVQAAPPKEIAKTPVATGPTPARTVGASPVLPPPQSESPASNLPYILGSLLVAIVATAIAVILRARKIVPPALTQATPTQKEILKPEDTPTEHIPPTDIRDAAIVPNAERPTDMLSFTKPLPVTVNRDFGNYRLEGVLGKGGMGTTFLATRLRDSLSVAIKVPHEHLLDNEEFVSRFLREGELGSTLHHPNIIRIYESGRYGDKPYIAMELLHGVTLETKLREIAPIEARAALEIVRDIALALDYARLKNIVHRDLKPENIMLPDRGGLKVMDYGIARIVGSPGLTASQAYLGTPSYSSPESMGGDVDQQSDLYSLGIILYRMLTGELPFRSTDALQVLVMHRNNPLPPFPEILKIPAEVYAMVSKLTAKDKSDRYANAESFLIDLNRLLHQV